MAAAYRGRVGFAISELADGSVVADFGLAGVASGGEAQLGLVVRRGGVEAYYGYGADVRGHERFPFSTDAVEGFVTAYLDGSLPVHQSRLIDRLGLVDADVAEEPHGEPPPRVDPFLGGDWTFPLDESHVVRLNAASFDGVVRDAKSHVLVQFYAPWCSACMDLRPEFAMAAEELSTAAKSTVRAASPPQLPRGRGRLPKPSCHPTGPRAGRRDAPRARRLRRRLLPGAVLRRRGEGRAACQVRR